MINVDIIYGNYLTNKIGPSTNISRYMKYLNLFESYSVKLNLYALSRKSSTNILVANEIKRGSRKNIKLILKKFFANLKLQRSPVYYRFFIYLEYIRHSRKIVKSYLKSNSESSIVVFDELFTCLEYCRRTKDKKKKIILFHHGSGDFFKMFELYYPGLNGSTYLSHLQNEFDFIFRNYVDKLVFVSDYALKNFQERNKQYGNFKQKLTRLYYGVETFDNNWVRRAQSGRKLVFCCVGTVNVRKGQRLIVEAYNELTAEEKRNFEFHFLGNGDFELERLQTLVDQREQSEALIFHGGVTNVEQYILASDAFILTSYDEGLPISIIEALKFGLPIIGTNVAGIPETIRGNGFLVETKITDIVDALRKIQRCDLDELGAESKKIFLERFTMEIYVKNFSQLLAEVYKDISK